MIFSNTFKLLRLAHSQECNIFIALLIGSAIAVEIFAIQLMDVLAEFYSTVSSSNTDDFLHTLCKAVLVTTLISVFKSFVQYATESLAIEWRNTLVHYVHGLYVHDQVAFTLLLGNGLNECGRDRDRNRDNSETANTTTASSNGESPETVLGGQRVVPIENADQRVTQDLDKFCSQSSNLLSILIVSPGLICFYTVYLWKLFGFVAPVSCITYFMLSLGVTALFSKRLAHFVYVHEKLEGNFRYQHSLYRHQIESIALLQGSGDEKKKLNLSFEKLYANSKNIINIRLPLYLVTNWFSYFGAIVNYSIVGISILYMSQHSGADSTTSSDRAALMARGSYACLYLIQGFTVICASAEILTEVLGYTKRIIELIQRCRGQTSQLKASSREGNCAKDAVDEVDSGDYEGNSLYALLSRLCDYVLSALWAILVTKSTAFEFEPGEDKDCGVTAVSGMNTPAPVPVPVPTDPDSIGTSAADAIGAANGSGADDTTGLGRVDRIETSNTGPGVSKWYKSELQSSDPLDELEAQTPLLAGASRSNDELVARRRQKSQEDVFKLIHYRSSIDPTGRHKHNSCNLIDIQNIQVYSSSSSRVILDHFSLQVARGAHLLITGNSGSGKSTITKLLCGLIVYAPIDINSSTSHSCNVAMNEATSVGAFSVSKTKSMGLESRASIACARNKIICLPQSPYVFCGNLIDNLLYGFQPFTSRPINQETETETETERDSSLLHVPHSVLIPIIVDILSLLELDHLIDVEALTSDIDIPLDFKLPTVNVNADRDGDADADMGTGTVGTEGGCIDSKSSRDSYCTTASHSNHIPLNSKCSQPHQYSTLSSSTPASLSSATGTANIINIDDQASYLSSSNTRSVDVECSFQVDSLIGERNDHIFHPSSSSSSSSTTTTTTVAAASSELEIPLELYYIIYKYVVDYDKILTNGEKQKLSVARLLLYSWLYNTDKDTSTDGSTSISRYIQYTPECIILDECTSALNLAMEAKVYELIIRCFCSNSNSTSCTGTCTGTGTHQCERNATIISVGHRLSLQKYHRYEIKVV